jgi:hypothetical protein
VRWQFGTFEDVHPIARAEGKVTFVYFRNWYVVECTDFEEQILKDPEVLRETRGMVCVPLRYDWDAPLAARWGLNKVPAYTLVAPSGKVLARRQEPITKGELLADIRAAKATLPPPAPTAGGAGAR